MCAKPLAVCALIAVVGIAPVQAGDIVLDMDPATAAVSYRLGAFLHTVNGTFRLSCGSIRFDPETGSAGGDIIVDLRTGKSGETARDNRMQSQILETPKYPQAVLSAEHIDGRLVPNGLSALTLHGALAIHGASHDMTIPLEIQSTDGQLTVHATFRVPYVAWGMKNPSTFFLRVDDTVDIDIAAAVTQTSEAHAAHACNVADAARSPVAR